MDNHVMQLAMMLQNYNPSPLTLFSLFAIWPCFLDLGGHICHLLTSLLGNVHKRRVSDRFDVPVQSRMPER